MTERIEYDEMGLFHENAQEFGLPYDGAPVVHRREVRLDDGRHLSALVWGNGPAEVVLLHGGAQNAHTWDTVALALGRPLVALDLPGHGHSGPSSTSSVDIRSNAADVGAAIRALAPEAKAVVGMSLGGITTLALADQFPELVRSVVLVDITPGVNQAKAKAISDFVNGPESFASFDDLLARTIEFNPTRTESSLRRGILHNAVQQPDGSWVWRYRRFAETSGPPDYAWLWDVVSRLTVPVVLVRGMRTQSVVDDDDEAELLRRAPHARVERIEEAGHSVQGDTPIELAALLADVIG
jgi:esterase